MNTFTFERNGELAEGVVVYSNDGMNLCKMSPSDIDNMYTHEVTTIVNNLIDIADEIFMYNGDEVIDTNVTLVNEDKNFICGFIIESAGGNKFHYNFIDWTQNDNHFRYVDDE